MFDYYSPFGSSSRSPAVSRRTAESIADQSYRQSHVGRGHEYDANLAASPFDDYLARAESFYLRRLLGTVLPARVGRYLDFACGTGRITRELESRADESLGVDVSATMLEAARDRCRFTQFIEADITRAATQEQHGLRGFDLVTAFRFFGNAEPELRRDALQAINRALRPGGALVLDNHRNPHALARWGHRLTGGRTGARLGYFELRSLLREAGFRVRWQRPIGAWLYRTGLFRKLREVDPAGWPENSFGHPWLAPVAPDFMLAAVKTHDA
jgi:SAM-dependent methyltransferase